MKTTTVRELRHQFTRVMAWIEHGETVTITKRTQPIAILTPAQIPITPRQWPNFKARIKKARKPVVRRNPAGRDLIEELRGERV